MTNRGPSWEHALSDVEVARLAGTIERNGYAVLENYIDDEELQPVVTLARAAIERSGAEYIGFVGSADFSGTILERIPQSDAFRSLCRRLYELGCENPAPPTEFYQITRILQGATAKDHSYIFHYDSYILTVLMPIEIPDFGRTGRLLLFPNHRPIRANYVTNLIDKILVDNRFTHKLYERRAYEPGTKVPPLSVLPGNIYFFWGYSTLHTNEPCAPNQLRVMSILHYGDPHKDSTLRSLLRKFRGSGRTY